MNYNPRAFIDLARHPVKFRLFLVTKLPSAYFSGVRIKDIDESRCVVTVPYKWFTRNPFRSTYFACLAMAGEMSTGALGMAYVYKRKPTISMLVVSIEANYIKKATGLTTFICEDGKLFDEAVYQASTTTESTTVTAKTTGRNPEGEVVAELMVTWSFKARSKRNV
jgi:hypothetical protein